MIESIANPRRRHQLVAILIFIVGMGSALVIYMTAGNSDESVLVSEYEKFKQFMHDLELYGGKANVITNKFAHWFDGLWHGQSLAFTVAFLSVVIALGYFFIARHSEYQSESVDANGNNRNDAGERR
jgi:phosphatidylglycerophosphate synthase